jgi:3D (Asp-Asp-Asp) domain-containing protein
MPARKGKCFLPALSENAEEMRKLFSKKNLRPEGNHFTGLSRFLVEKALSSQGLRRMRPRVASSYMGTRFFLILFGFALLVARPAFGTESSLLARITVYWPGEGQLRACSNGARLRAGHCAVDPKRIPYGSRVQFPDAMCLAVDSGPAVVSRTAARACGRNAAQKSAIVIDRFFESKEAALSWERAHPHFMTVRVLPPGSHEEDVATLNASAPAAKTAPNQSVPASLPKFDSTKLQLGLSLDSVLRANHRRT